MLKFLSQTRLLFLLSSLILLLSACGAVTTSDAAPRDTNSNTKLSYESMTQNSITDVAAGAVTNVNNNFQNNAKLILKAYIDMETTDFDTTMQQLSNAIESFNGYFENNETYNYSGNRQSNLIIRLPKEQYNDFINQTKGMCHILSLRESKENVSEQYYDTELRLKTQQTKYDRLQELLFEADKMEDIITIESAISDVELQIEQLKGNLRNYDNLIDYATVSISLQEVYKLADINETPTSFGDRLSSAFTNGFHNFSNTMENFIIWIAYNMLNLIITIAIIIAIIIIIKHICTHPNRLKQRRRNAQSTLNDNKQKDNKIS